ncbi:hypothetical protein Tco_0252339 [Tanacetum coccineum]
MEYLVKLSKRRAFWSLNEDILKIMDSEYQYAITIKKDTAYPCLHSPKTTKEQDLYAVSREPQYTVSKIEMTKVIKGKFKIIKDVKVKDVSLTCDTPLEVFNKEVIRLSGMGNDLFTYEVEVTNIPCKSKIDDDSEHEVDDDMGYDPSDVAFIEWLASKIFNYKTMDHYTMKALWIYWIRGDDEVELTDEESSDDEDEIAENYEWYEDLEDSELKDEALRNKAIMEGFINEVITEYLVKLCKRRAFWSLNEDILKIIDSDYQYAVSIKEDTAYPCLHSSKTTKEQDLYSVSREPQYDVSKI